MTGAQATLGVIPADAGRQIEAGCAVDKLDFERLRKETDIVGYPILPFIRQLDAMCPGESGKYLVSLLSVRRQSFEADMQHWGATTQDVSWAFGEGILAEANRRSWILHRCDRCKLGWT